MITGMYSKYDHDTKGRSFGFHSVGVSGATCTPQPWTEYWSTYYQCPNNQALYAVETNKAQIKIRCCAASDRYKLSQAGYQFHSMNEFLGDGDFKCPTKQVVTTVLWIYSADKQDIKLQFQCSLVTPLY